MKRTIIALITFLLLVVSISRIKNLLELKALTKSIPWDK